MKAAAALLMLAAACGHKAPAPPPFEHDLDERAGSAATAAAIDAAPAAPAVVVIPALAGDGPHAFVADANGLIEIAASGKTQQIAAVKPSWCTADARGQVVWFANDEGLFGFDLVDRTIHSIVAGPIDMDDVMIDWGNEKVGGQNKVDYQVALGVRMTNPPRLSSELGCDGDQAVYCYDDGGGQTLRAEVVDKQRRLDAVHLVDATWLASVVARGADRSLWTPPPVPPAVPATKPKVDRRGCEEDAKACGKLIAIPASPLWLVITANSRGDFFHETRELWDPATGEFVAPQGGTLIRARKPQVGDTDYIDLRIAPNGLLSIGGVVFDPAHVVYTPAGDVPITCGWSTGGWRVPGPTE